MSVERQNILDIIGSKSNRYHSCILTTFSFDFHFFEYKVMRQLRRCGIINVNVLVDGHYYGYLMNEASGEEMKYRSGYSLYPVFQSKVFHPKLWLLIGESEGLLVIGSGNLTHSGNGLNDEVWGAFHVSSRDTSNRELFAAAWQYVQGFCHQSHGLFKQKTTEWIRDNSKWLADLPLPIPFSWLPLKNNHQVAFLYNSTESHLWDQLLRLLGREQVIAIQVVSPYYDPRGLVLARLHAAFPAASIQVVLDERGSIPHRFEPDESFLFYAWEQAGLARKVSNQTYSRLHAKLIHFSTASSLEYCLFGSANMTVEGMGATDSSNVNQEASLLIKAPQGGLKKQVGLTLTESKPIHSFSANQEEPIFEEVLRHNRNSIRLFAAELFEDIITVFGEGYTEEDYLVEVCDSTNRRLGMLEGFHPKNGSIVKTGTLGGIHYLQIWSTDGQKPISNKLLITNYVSILKTNPNTFSRELDQISQDIQESGDLSRVLDLLQSLTLEAGGSMTYAHGTGAVAAVDRVVPVEPMINLDAFKPFEFSTSPIHNLLHSPTIRILELIQSLPARPSEFYATIQEDEQTEDVVHLVGDDQTDATKTPATKSIALLRSEQRKLVTYFHRLHKEYITRINLRNNRLITREDRLITTDDLAKYLIALQLMIQYGGRVETVDEQAGTRTKFSYLPHGAATLELTHLRGCCLNLIGSFLSLVKVGFSTPDSEAVGRRQQQYIQEALISSVLCILNTKWPKEEARYQLLLLMNSLHCFGLKNGDDLVSSYDGSITKVIEQSDKLKKKCPDFEKNLAFLQEQVYPLYYKAVHNREQKIFETTTCRGSFVYTSLMGYCFVSSVEKKSGKSVLRLARPGFPWDNKGNDFLFPEPLEVGSFVSFEL